MLGYLIKKVAKKAVVKEVIKESAKTTVKQEIKNQVLDSVGAKTQEGEKAEEKVSTETDEKAQVEPAQNASVVSTTPTPTPDGNGGDESDENKTNEKKSTKHGEQRAKEAKDGDPNRNVGDVNAIKREGKKYVDSETGNTVYVKGDKVYIDSGSPNFTVVEIPKK